MNDEQQRILRAFLKALKELGFDKDEPISGADTVDVVAVHYKKLKTLLA